MCGMSKKFYRGNSWQNSWQNTRREIHIENHRKIAGKIHRNLQNGRRWDNRKVHRKGGTDTGLADDSDLTFVEVYDFFHHREANAVSLCSMGAVSLVETVEYMVLCLLIHAASIVQNLENHLVFLPVQLQFYLSVLRGKFDGVVNQVNPYLV